MGLEVEDFGIGSFFRYGFDSDFRYGLGFGFWILDLGVWGLGF